MFHPFIVGTLVLTEEMSTGMDSMKMLWREGRFKIVWKNCSVNTAYKFSLGDLQCYYFKVLEFCGKETYSTTV